MMKKTHAIAKRRPQTEVVLPRHVLQDRVVQRLQEAENALSVAVGVDQVKLVMDVAAAQEVFAKRQSLGELVIGFAFALKIRALGKLADLLQEMPKAKGSRGQLVSRGVIGGVLSTPPIAAPPTLAELGIDKEAAKVIRQLKGVDNKTRTAIEQRETTIAKVQRERKAVEIRKAISLPDAKYRVLYADPPWSYNDKADAGSVQSGGAEMHYPSMSIKELCQLDVPSICEPKAVLFLWVTSPLLFECAPVIKAWGFSYRALFVWDKVKHNMGHYNSVRHEFLLICIKGSCTPDVVTLVDSVQSIEKTTHSTKPKEFRQIIETLYPYGKRLELFAREQADGWDAFGFEAASVVEAG